MSSAKRSASDPIGSQSSKKPRRLKSLRVSSKPNNAHTVSAMTITAHTSGHIGRRLQRVKVSDQTESGESGDAGLSGNGDQATSSASSSDEPSELPTPAHVDPVSQEGTAVASSKPKRKKRVNTTSVSLLA